MRGIIAMKDDDQRFVVQVVHMLLEGGSRATPSADRTPENSYCVAIGTFETCRRALRMSVDQGRPEVIG